MIDWYGPQNTHHNTVTMNIKTAAEASPNFEFAIIEASGALPGSADPTTKLLSAIQYMITASAGAGGTISPTGAVTVNSGANQTFTGSNIFNGGIALNGPNTLNGRTTLVLTPNWPWKIVHKVSPSRFDSS